METTRQGRRQHTGEGKAQRDTHWKQKKRNPRNLDFSPPYSFNRPFSLYRFRCAASVVMSIEDVRESGNTIVSACVTKVKQQHIVNFERVPEIARFDTVCEICGQVSHPSQSV